MIRRRFFASFAFFLFALTGCPDPTVEPDAAIDAGRPTSDAGPPTCADEPTGDPRALFVLRRTETEPFFDLPFPNDLRLTSDGTVDLDGFPNARNSFVSRYVDALMRRLRGWGTNGSIYFRFSHPLDVSSLPATPQASLEDGASAFVIDIDPDSPAFGTRHPIVVHYQECQTQYWSSHMLALRPVFGVPLASATRYAAVITNAVRTEDGAAYGRDADFEALLGSGGDASVEAARATYGDAVTVLETAGVATGDIVSLTVFTTQDAIGETIAIRDWMVANYPPPALIEDDLELESTSGAIAQITGRYGPVPIFQAGEVPYVETGGAIELDASGDPIVHGEYNARFTMTLPRLVPMPENGYPIILYAHGTGGDHESFADDEARWLTPLGFAVMGIDQIHHGERNPSDVDPSGLFFNFANPDAGRDNNRQSALDVVQQARLVGEMELPGEFLGRSGEVIRFDPTQVFFMGHSQGGLNGPLFMAMDDHARAGVLSAASGVITPSLLYKVDPISIPEIVRVLLMLPGQSAEESFALEAFTEEHPIATIVQMWIDAADGSNYAHLIFRSPREGFAPKSVLMTEGMMDTFSPPTSIEALAGSMFVPVVTPVARSLVSLELAGIDSVSPPVTMNVAGGLATAGLLQFPSDGHFAIYRNEVARNHVVDFFESMRTGGVGTISPPR